MWVINQLMTVTSQYCKVSAVTQNMNVFGKTSMLKCVQKSKNLAFVINLQCVEFIGLYVSW